MKILKKLLIMGMSISILISSALAENETPTPDPVPDEIATSGDAEPAWKTWDRITNFPDEDGVLRFWMDDLDGTPASLTLTYTFDDGEEPVSGAKVGVVKFADLAVKNGDARYTIIPSLKEKYPEIDFSSMSRGDYDTFAKELAALKLPSDKEVVTDDKGVAKFEDLDYGLYLVTENGKTGKAEKFFYFKPFIINVPFPDVEDDKYNGKWQYVVEALPKTQIRAEMPTPTPTPYVPRIQTGDDSNVGFYMLMGVCLTSLLILFIVFTGKKADETKEER